jgi:hypothetical protein
MVQSAGFARVERMPASCEASVPKLSQRPAWSAATAWSVRSNSTGRKGVSMLRK